MRGPLPAVAVAVVIVLVVLAVLGTDLLGTIGAGMSSGGDDRQTNGPSASASAAVPLVVAASSPVGPSTPRKPATASPPSAAPTSPSSEASAPTSPSPAGSPASSDARPGAAPTSALGFRPTSTVVPMGLPFRAATRFVYGDGFRRPRDGVVHPYDLVRGVAADGTLLRAHDGQDLLVPVGTLVVAPLAGVVVDPSTVMRPWDAARYGKVVMIRSSEPTSAGYVVLMAHLSRQSVPVGATVRRGQVVGRSGRTGNAAATTPHLHIEVRAPFRIRYGYGGVIRSLDVFDIRPSLEAASRGD